MQYLGGKKKLAPKLAAELERHRKPGQRFVDMFAGSLPVVAAMGNHGPRVANDKNDALINMYRAYASGWRPPENVSEVDYAKVKANPDPTDPLTAFVAIGCSYGGKWLGGYARDQQHGRNFSATAARSLARTFETLVDVEFTSLDFDAFDVLPSDFVYIDPEYRGGTGYKYFREPFPHERLAAAVRRWVDLGATVFASEYQALDGYELVASWPVRKSRLKGPQIENLYRVVF